MLNWLHRIFGRWNVVSSFPARSNVIFIVSGKTSYIDGFVILEKHSRTHEERAFFERYDGKKEAMSVKYAKSIQP